MPRRFLLACGLALLLSSPQAAIAAEKPNVVLIFADDLGWKDVGYQGSDFYETPNIDALAKKGMVFTSAYAGAGNCAPSRACLLSGTYTPRHHVFAVGEGLRREGIIGGRKAVSMIVGRDPNLLDRAGVCRASIESLAENYSDGVVAPAFYYALFGLPGLFAYKMLNTADSMIGHRTPRYREFGWASARLDDLANWPAARLSALFIALGTWLRRGRPSARKSVSVALRDHGLHRSPNSGWPESAMAGALDIALAGPRVYAGEQVMEPMQNSAGRKNIGPTDIDLAIEVFWAACTVLTAFVICTGLAIEILI